MDLQVNGQAVHIANATGAIQKNLPFLVLVHGAGSDHTVWNGQAARFKRTKVNAIAPDLPGHGASAGESPASIEDMGAWLIGLLDALQAEKVVLAGHSMGSLVALEAASRMPGTTAALVLLGTAVPMPVNRALLDAARRQDPAAVDIIMQYGHGPELQAGQSPAADQLLTRTRDMLLTSLDGALFADLNACNSYARGLEAATAVTCPVTVLTGEQDRMTPVAAVQDLLGKLPNASQVIVPACGHMILSEKPDAVSEALTAAVTGCAGI